VSLVSIMVDPLDALTQEVSSREIATIVATDEDRSVSKAYDALGDSMHPGKKPGHTFVLVDKDGQMIWRWDWPSNSPMYTDVDEIYEGVAESLESLS